MSTRTVIVAAPSTSKAVKIEGFTGSTFADLKRNSQFASLYQSGLEAILSPGNVTLTRDDASLPSENFKVFLVPTKNKAGAVSASDARAIGQEIGEAIVKAVRMTGDSEVQALRDELISTVEDFFDVSLEGSECPECDQALEESKKYV